MKEYLAINLKQFIAENKSIDSVGDLVKAGKNSENAETVSIAENLEQQLQKGDVKNATVGKLYKALLSDQKSFIKTFGNIGKFEATHTDKKTNAEVQAVEIKDSNGKTDPDNIKVVSSDGQEKTLNKNVFNALYEKNSEDNNNIDNNQTSDNSNSETSQNEVKRVEYGTKRLANSIRNVFEKNGVKADDYSLIESANTKVLSSENAVIDDDFIKAYADTFSEALKNNEPELYQTLSESDNLSEQLVNYVTKGENLKASGDVSEANNIAETFSDIVSGSISKVSYGMTGMYGNNASVSIQLSNAENINTPNANESHELRDIMQSESISMYSGENASQNVKQIERTLISRGTDDTTREQIIENATMLENILNGTDVTINQVFNDVSTMTSYVIGEIKKDVGISTKYWEIFNANLKAIINTGEKAKADMVTEYVKVYTEAMKANQKDVYSEALINQNGTDISLELPFTILQGIMPANLKNAGKYRKVAGDIKSIIKKADQAIDEIKSQIKSAVQEESVTKEENALAGENKPNNTNGNTETEEVQAAKKPKNISLTRMGDFYEVFGDEALEVAEKLSLKPTHKNINGVKTAIVGFPVNVLEKYQNELGNNYNFVISANTDDAIQNQSNNTNNIIEHPYNVQNVSQDFMEAVDENMLSFIDKATGNPNDNKSIYTIGKTNYKLNRKIKEVTGIDTTLFTHSIKANSIRHIIKNHGINGSTDNSMANIDDIARMGYILRNFDNIEMLDSISKEYRDKNQQPSKMIKLSKRIDGTYYVVEAVPDANAKRLMVVTAYIKKASTQQTENVRALSSNVRNASVDVEASDNNISPNTQNVNSNVDTNIKNSATKDDISQDNDIKSNDTKENVVSTQPKKQSDEKSADTADTSDVAQNKDVSNDTDIIDHTKGANGMKLKTENTTDKESKKNIAENKTNDNTKSLKDSPTSDTIEETKNEGEQDNDREKSNVLAGEGVADDRGLHTGADDVNDEERTEGNDKADRQNSREVLQGHTVDKTSGHTDGNDGERADRADDAGEATAEAQGADNGRGRGRDELLGRRDGSVRRVGGESEELTENTANKPDVIETEVKKVAKKRPSNKDNFVITDDIASEYDNTSPDVDDNVRAIEKLIELENSGRKPTDEEKRILAKYKGWGGIDTRAYNVIEKLDKLYSYEERMAMRSSENNAFFTPTKVIDSIYSGLKRLGFRGGNVLETSMGIGNFFGRMPANISSKSYLTGIELESYTARIAQMLYPGATVINMPFQDVAIKNGSYDLVIGNVPFGQNKISYNKKKYSLHNYFIVSSLDKVRDGGIVAVITSANTLDSYDTNARKTIMDKADVVACYKLPEKVFSRNANTDVQTDLLILRKRASGEKSKGDSILNVTTTPDGHKINEYFLKHPENILGTLSKGTNAWGEITTVLDDGDFYDKLNNAVNKLPKDIISGKSDLKPTESILSISDKPKFFEKGGKIYSDDGAGVATEVIKNADVAKKYIKVRDSYKALLTAYDNDLSEDEIKPLREQLSQDYDDFFEKYGAITGDGKKKIGNKKTKNNTFLEADSDYYLVSGLEIYDAKNKKFSKSALFEKDTLRKKKVDSVDTASDALAVSLNESGRIDFKRMQELTSKSEEELLEELGGEIVYTPEGDYVLTDVYLSGNIYEKLEAVKGKPEFKEQEQMLEKVIPPKKEASDIAVKLGANYIDSKYIEEFAYKTFGTRLTIRKDVSGGWVIEGVRQSRYGDVVNVKYGCSAFNAVQLLEKILNDGDIKATKKVGSGKEAKTVFDPEMTDIAKQKADDIRLAFETWVFSDSERRTDIVNTYNKLYNNYRSLDYGKIAEKLTFDTMDKTIREKLYPHQRKGIARFLFGGNTLFAHGVGTGKTYGMIASVMEAKRMGMINKTAMVVPNNKVVDFKKDILKLYPSAKVLVIDTANKKRQTMLGLVNSNDWDIILIAKSTFTKVPVSRELQANYISQQLEEISRQISSAENDREVSRRQYKSLIKQRDNAEQKLKDLNSDTKRDENSVEFEKLGIDCICVDEAHNYKSIMTPSKLDIKGLVNKNNAQLANDMLMKLDYLRSINGKIIFGTGTPITNTVSEIYNMTRMVRPDIFEEANIHSLDEWVNTFAKIENITEIGIDNKIKNKSTQIIKSFLNAGEMIGMFKQFADVVFTEDVVKDLPKAVYKDIEIEAMPEHKKIQEHISSTLSKAKKSDILRIHGQLMSMADVAAVDLKMLGGADSEYNLFKDLSINELEYENSKINTMCNIVMDEYTKSSNIKGTQIIFCDKGSGSGKVYSFNLHKDIKQKLIDRGIPGDEIVIVKNQNDAKLEELYEKVNNGDVRVLIGTSQKMAEGLNVQKRVVAIHHPTVTYKPSDWEQGNARGVRSGNINEEVRIYRYLQQNTFDSHKWQAQDRKGEMIRNALRGDLISEIEDIGADENGGEMVDAATAMAITSGNPLVKEKIDIDKEVTRLKTLKRNYLNELYRYQDAIAKNPDLIRAISVRLNKMKDDIAIRDTYKDKLEININGKKFTKQADANKALSNAVKSAPKNGKYKKLGTINGFNILFKGDTGGMNYSLVLKNNNEYSVEYAGNGNNIARMLGVLNRLDTEEKRVSSRLETLKKDLEFAQQEVTKPFEKETELQDALNKQKDITYRYEHYGENRYSLSESEENLNGQTRSNILSGNSKRTTNEGTREQTRRISEFKQQIKGETKAKRQSTAKEFLKQGYAKEVIEGNHKYNLIDKDKYNADMASIVETGKRYGVDVGFFVGNAVRKFDSVRNFLIDGIKTADNKILLRYDGVHSPQMLLLHEIIHAKWGTPEIQRIREIILGDLSKEEIDSILSSGRYKEYMELYNGDKDATLEEFVADVFAGMNEYSDDYIAMSADYFLDNKVLDIYSPSKYTVDTDSGGNKAIIDNIGFGNDYSLSYDMYNFNIPYSEKRQLDDYIMHQNHNGKKLKIIDCKEIGNNFYVWENNSKTDYTVVNSIPIVGNEEIINELRSGIANGAYRRARSIGEWSANIRSRRGSSTVLNANAERTTTDGSDDRFSLGQSESDKVGHSEKSDRNFKTKYSLATYERDSKGLTDERKREILKKFDEDRTDVAKPSQRQLWGERTAWIAHNMTRVFPDIPERGERAIDFALFDTYK